MKTILTLLFVLPFAIQAQTFEGFETTDLVPTFQGSMLWKDNQLLVTGFTSVTTSSATTASNVYSKNSLGAFAIEHSFAGVQGGFFDSYDGTFGISYVEIGGDVDGNEFGTLRVRNAAGGYDDVSIIPLRQATGFSADLDGDGDRDIWSEGRDASNIVRRCVYENINGVINPTPVKNVTDNACDLGDAVYADTDNDGDLDVLTTGQNQTSGHLDAILWRNDGAFNFSPITDAFSGGPQAPWVSISAQVLVDIDNDGNKDAIIMGTLGACCGEILYSYLGDGDNHFTFFQQIGEALRGDLATDDVDGDGDKDLYVLAYDVSANSKRVNLFLNNGSGTFTLDTTNNFDDVDNGMIAVIDLDEDGRNDFLYMGDAGSIPISNPQVRAYRNTTCITFYRDLDGDGHGDPTSSTTSCVGQPTGYVLDNTDTDDADPCVPVNPPGYTGHDGENSIWRNADCDDDSYLNGLEYDMGTDPYDPTDFPLGIADNNLFETIVIFPNPTDGLLRIKDDNKTVELVTIYDTLGRLLLQIQYRELIDLSSFPSGLYLIEMRKGNQSMTKKIIKK
ncbi:T9SS type A sorting domain-containing protein [Patescibacteria group bacterium]|nr:T9SS type A sorting domain-containing protein [Patescibacteria group bacterium]